MRYRNKKGEFQSKADKRLQRKIALAQARQVWQWSVFVILIGFAPYMEIKDRLNKEYVFENPSAASVSAQEKEQESIKDSHDGNFPGEAPIIDHPAVNKPTATVSENQRGNEYTHLPSSLSDIEAKILEAFNGDKVALAVAKGESGLDPNAKGWNCYYHKTTGEVLTSDEAAKTPKNLRESKSCKEEHRKFAWSVDCGVWQINSLTKECPEHLMDAEVNIAIAKEMQSKRGWSPWVAYWNGQYKNHMN